MSRRRTVSVLTLIVLGSWAWAFSNRFVLDDAFISFRYARHLAEGHGLVFNISDRVEGYTNFLWTLLMAAAFPLGVDPVAFSWAVGLTLFPLSIWLTYRIGVRLFGLPATGLLAAGLVGAHFTYSAFATSGLETQLQSFLLLALTDLFLRNHAAPRPASLLLFSLCAAAAFLTRMDSACFIAPAYLFLLLHWRRTDPQRALVRIAWATLPALLITLGWLFWKLAYYGHILPNTFFAKTGSPFWIAGVQYVALYFISYGLIVFFAVVAVILWKQEWRPALNGKHAYLVSAVLLWVAYLVMVGGDFMEFRMMAPVVPFLFILVAWAITRCFESLPARIAWVVFLCAVSFIHGQRGRLFGVETVRALHAHVREASWIEAGQALHQHFGGTDVVLGVTAAGAIPFHAQLRTVDMLGLNDAWVARNGIPTVNPSRRSLGEKAGHRIKAPMQHLVEQGVHLLVGHPRITKPDATRWNTEDFLGLTFDRYDAPPPEGTRVLEIPIRPDRVLIALYMREHPAIQDVIERQEWRHYPLRPINP